VYEDIGVAGKWVFAFQASGESLFADRETIPIAKVFYLENGQKVSVDELVLTPASTTLNYRMYGEKENVYEYDVLFMVEDETGQKHNPAGASTAGRNSHIRLEVLDQKIEKLIITPYVISGKEGKEKTDYYRVLTEETFEVNLH
jgi:hypothetical protein